MIGDTVSFWLGRKFGPILPKIWTSIFIGRFFGPLRAAVPLVAGMMHMSPWRFYLANVLSAVVWAPALVYFGDLLTRALGRETSPRKSLYRTHHCGRGDSCFLDATAVSTRDNTAGLYSLCSTEFSKRGLSTLSLNNQFALLFARALLVLSF